MSELSVGEDAAVQTCLCLVKDEKYLKESIFLFSFNTKIIIKWNYKFPGQTKFQYIKFFLCTGYSKVAEQVHIQFLGWQEAPLPLPSDYCHEAGGADTPSCLSLGCLHMHVAGNFFFFFLCLKSLTAHQSYSSLNVDWSLMRSMNSAGTLLAKIVNVLFHFLFTL